MRIYTIILLSFFIFIRTAYSSDKNDSLKKYVLDNMKAQHTNEALYDMAYQVSENLSNENIHHAFQYNYELQKVASETLNDTLRMVVNTNFGRLYKKQGIYDKALEYYIEASVFRAKLSVAANAWTTIMIGNIFYEKEMYNKAIQNYTLAENNIEKDFNSKDEHEFWELEDYYNIKAVVNNNLALCKRSKGDHRGAIVLFRKAINFRQMVDYNLGLAYQYHYIANSQIELDQIDSALMNLKKSKEFNDKFSASEEERNNESVYLYAEIDLLYSKAFFKMNKIDKAYEYFQNALNKFDEANNNAGKIRVLLDVAYIEIDKNNYDQALKLYKQAFEQANQYDFDYYKIASMNNIAELYLKMGADDKAIKFFINAKNLNDSLNKINEKETLLLIEENIRSENTAKSIEDTKEAELINQLKLRKQKYFIIVLIISVILMFVISIILYRNYKIKKKKNKELSEINSLLSTSKEELSFKHDALLESENELKEAVATKDKFFSIIAHDLKNPVSTYTNSLDLLSKMYDEMQDDERLEFITELYKSSIHMKDLLDNLLTWSRTQNGKIAFTPELCTPYSITENVISLLSDNAKAKQITIINNIDKQLEIFADLNMLSTVFRNLISNAIKFTRNNGEIIVSNSSESQQILFNVQDNGIGIPSDKIPKIFSIDNTYSSNGTNNEKGTGLGLILCREFVEKHNGKIWADSKIGSGSVFYFTISNNI